MPLPTSTQLATEVITLVRDNRITPKRGAVMLTPIKFLKKGYPLRGFLTKLKECETCATGALLFALIINHISINSPGQHPFNAYCPNWETVNLSDTMYQTLCKIFTPTQLRLIEHSFEGIHHESNINSKTLTACKDFYRLYPSSVLRLKAIMANIIENQGTFKP